LNFSNELRMPPIEISCNGFNVTVTLKRRVLYKTTTKRAGSSSKVAEKNKIPLATLNYNGKLSLSSTPRLNLITAWSSISIGPQLAIDLVVDLIDAGIVSLIDAGIVSLIDAGIVDPIDTGIVDLIDAGVVRQKVREGHCP
jgi:hypothetical protein